MHTRRTFVLDDSWDIHLDDAGGIALESGPEATAQAAANECRLFTGDACFRMAEGVPHYVAELGAKIPARPLFHSYLRQAVRRVADVLDVTGVELAGFDRDTRTLTGTVWFVTREGENVRIDL
jgi:hypothetical protein